MYSYSISLRLRHPSMDPQSMTDILELTPKTSWQAGKPRFTPTGKLLKGIRQETYWTTVLVKGEYESLNLSQAILNAIQKISHHRNFLRKLRDEGGSTEFFIGWFFDRQSGDTLPAGLLTEVGDIGIDLSFDIYAAEPSTGDADAPSN